MNRVSRTIGSRDMLASFRVWSHRRAGARIVHHGRNGRTHRANIYLARLRGL